MKTTAIKIEGNLISPELFDGIDDPARKGQSAKDFGLQGKNLREVISNAWSIANSHWNIYQTKLKTLPENSPGTEETRKHWIIPLLEELGYSPEFQRSAEVIEGKTYMITHRDAALGGFPVVVMGYNDSLDKKRSEGGGPRLSPHALLQEYLNIKEDYMYGIVTNGKVVRVLRDSVRMVRMSYLEFDLELMMENQLFAEFAIMFRLLHASRMPKATADAAESIIEAYYLNAIESGSRIRENLSSQMKVFIRNFGNGMLRHPDNEELRSRVRDNIVSADEYYEKILRLIYRILFLMVTEERGILFPGKETIADDEYRKIIRFKELYNNFYSMSRLRRLSERKRVLDPKETDLYASLINSFRLFEDERYGQKLGIKPLGGSIFSENGINIFVNAMLDNGTLLDCIDRLNRYYDRTRRIMIRVNYAALSVEEFGSVYEELLEYKGKFNADSSGTVSFALVKGDERSASGSHYTPEELVQPLIKHSLEYLITDKVKGRSGIDAANNLLTLRVCDPACGSGHVLLSVARRLAFEVAKYRTGEDQPTPLASRVAIRDVISKCIHGVDKNPMAVELCKVALWLESYNPGLPLSYLDEKIKVGDSIVGLTTLNRLEEGVSNHVYKPIIGDEKDLCYTLKRSNEKSKKDRSTHAEQLNLFRDDWKTKYDEIVEEFKSLNEIPDDSLESIEKKDSEYRKLKNKLQSVKDAADFATSLWFIPKTNQNLKKLGTEDDYLGILSGNSRGYELQIATAQGYAAELKYFHWFIEFPAVEAEGGFDLIVGNPPFLGGTKISTSYGQSYLKHLLHVYETTGRTNLVAYFFLRGFEILKKKGFLAFISTDTVAEGSTRETCLLRIKQGGGTIVYAKSKMDWPGDANVSIVLISFIKSNTFHTIKLNNHEVDEIDSNLSTSSQDNETHHLHDNSGLSFIGVTVNGKGFLLEPDRAKKIIATDQKYNNVILPYINGQDLARDPISQPSRWIINFFDWDIKFCEEKYPICYEIVEKNVKPERLKAHGKLSNSFDIVLVEKWWQYATKGKELFTLRTFTDSVLVTGRVSKYLAFTSVPSNYVFSDQCIIIANSDKFFFTLINNSIHEEWAWNKGTSQGGVTLRYSVSRAFETYPFPILNGNSKDVLEILGKEYYVLRQSIKLGRWIGLTDTYNLFHNPDCRMGNPDKVAKLKTGIEKELTLEQAVQKIEELRAKRVEMEKAVLAAYGWSDIDPGHDFHEVDYLPEKDRIRFTISPAARREVLDRLMALNHARRKEEEDKGLWPKKK